MICPGNAGGLIIGLGAQGRRGIHKIADVVAVLIDVLVDRVNIEVVQLNSGYFVITNHQSSGHAGGDTGNGSLQGNTGH